LCKGLFPSGLINVLGAVPLIERCQCSCSYAQRALSDRLRTEAARAGRSPHTSGRRPAPLVSQPPPTPSDKQDINAKLSTKYLTAKPALRRRVPRGRAGCHGPPLGWSRGGGRWWSPGHSILTVESAARTIRPPL